jgi:hypothetical protein
MTLCLISNHKMRCSYPLLTANFGFRERRSWVSEAINHNGMIMRAGPRQARCASRDIVMMSWFIEHRSDVPRRRYAGVYKVRFVSRAIWRTNAILMAKTT